MSDSPRVCVQWPRLGPYHLARLRAAQALFSARGGEIIALETAGTDTTYAWREETDPEPFRREQVFPSGVVEGLAPADVHRAVREALDQIQPDAVAINSYSAPDAQAALAWTRAHDRAAVCMMESTARDAPRSWLREQVKSVIVRSFDAALAGGTPQREYLLDMGFEASFIFRPYDVIDNDYFEAVAAVAREAPERVRQLPGLSGGPFFLASGRFVPRKNLDGLIDAYARYRSRSAAPWRLVLLGDGPERAALEQRVLALGLGEAVTFAGFQQVESLPAYYALAGAFVHPAFVEPWGLVVNEALAASTPVIVSRTVGAATDLVEEGIDGYTFDPNDVGTLAGLLAEMASLPVARRLQMGQEGKRLVAEWSPERFAEGLWDAVAAGSTRMPRRGSLVARGLLWAQRMASTRADSFHVIRD